MLFDHLIPEALLSPSELLASDEPELYDLARLGKAWEHGISKMILEHHYKNVALD